MFVLFFVCLVDCFIGCFLCVFVRAYFLFFMLCTLLSRLGLYFLRNWGRFSPGKASSNNSMQPMLAPRSELANTVQSRAGLCPAANAVERLRLSTSIQVYSSTQEVYSPNVKSHQEFAL